MHSVFIAWEEVGFPRVHLEWSRPSTKSALFLLFIDLNKQVFLTSYHFRIYVCSLTTIYVIGHEIRYHLQSYAKTFFVGPLSLQEKVGILIILPSAHCLLPQHFVRWNNTLKKIGAVWMMVVSFWWLHKKMEQALLCSSAFVKERKTTSIPFFHLW